MSPRKVITSQMIDELKEAQTKLMEALVPFIKSKYTEKEIDLLYEISIRDDLRDKHYLFSLSDHEPDDLDAIYQDAARYFIHQADTDILTCPLDEVPLYIKTITIGTKMRDRATHAAAIWRLELGK